MSKKGFIFRRKSKPQRSEGFTLVEILVVMSIIGILSTLGFTSYQGIQGKARDTTRKADLTQIGLALEAYKLSHNYKYIDAGTPDDCSGGDTAKLYTDIAPLMANRKVPIDPLTSVNYCYISINNGVSFRLFATLENCSQTGPNYYCGDTYNYTVFSNNVGTAPAP